MSSRRIRFIRLEHGELLGHKEECYHTEEGINDEDDRVLLDHQYTSRFIILGLLFLPSSFLSRY